MRNSPAVRLTGEASRVFAKLRRRLPKLSVSQTEVLALFAMLRARHAHAVEKLNEEGEIVSVTRTDSHGRAFKTKRINPWLRVVQSTEQRMLIFLKQLPSMGIGSEDPLDKLLNKEPDAILTEG